jgi:hypothetical protein
LVLIGLGIVLLAQRIAAWSWLYYARAVDACAELMHAVDPTFLGEAGGQANFAVWRGSRA